MGNYPFRKKDRLTRKKVIETLFAAGKSFTVFPLKVLFHPSATAITQVLITVPARNFRATDRNTLKRRIREGYRLNKGLLTTSLPYSLAYIYTAREVLPSTTIHQAIQRSLERLNRYEKKD